MAKRAVKKKARKVGPSVEERVLLEEQRMLARSVRHERKVRELSRALVREHAAAKRALRDVAMMAMNAELPAERTEDRGEPAKG